MRNYLIRLFNRLEQKERKIQVIYPRFFERTMLRIFTTTYLRNYGLMNIGHRNDESIRGLINFELKSIRPILASSKADAAMICTSAYLSRYRVSPILPPPLDINISIDTYISPIVPKQKKVVLYFPRVVTRYFPSKLFSGCQRVLPMSMFTNVRPVHKFLSSLSTHVCCLLMTLFSFRLAKFQVPRT